MDLLSDTYLAHHGILGQKWGVRRYQNEDGTWTEAGKKRYGIDKKIDVAAKETANEYRKAWYKSPSAGLYTQQIADRIKEPVLLPQKTVDKILESASRVNDLNDKLYETYPKEISAAVKTSEFQNDLDERLYRLFGDGVDDEVYFDIIADDVYGEMLSDTKYIPKTSQITNEMLKEIDTYLDMCKQAAKEITDKLGDKTVAQVAGETIKYSDVISSMIRRDTDGAWVSYVARHGVPYALYDNDAVDYSCPYTMDEYNKKHGSK